MINVWIIYGEFKLNVKEEIDIILAKSINYENEVKVM
jgi:hypothetical protein